MDETNAPNSPWVVNATAETFDAEVFQRSQTVPVVVDFWATWCAPCRMLGPVLEKLAADYNGRFVLVKAETEQVPEAANQFQVQSIPAVYAVCEGEIVDGFVGALAEPQIRAWLDRILIAGEFIEANRIEASNPAEAEAKFRAVAAAFPNQPAAAIGLARVLLSQGRRDEAATILATLEKRGFLEPEAEKVKAALGLGEKKQFDVPARRQAAAEQPGDLPRQLQLAEALAGDAQYEEALQLCLALVQRDRRGLGEPARQIMIDIFRVLPDDSDLTTSYRRKLSAALY